MTDIPARLRAASQTLTGSGQEPSNEADRSETAGAGGGSGTESTESAAGAGEDSGSASGPGRETNSPTDTGELPLDLAFEILKNARRRRVLEELSRASGDLTTGELSERIAAWENDKPMAEISSEERKRVYVGLYQCHLPKMDDAGVVVFNKDRGIVTPGEHADLLDRYLTPTPHDIPAVSSSQSRLLQWAGVTVLVAGLLGLSLAVGTVSGVPTATLGLVVMLAVTGTMCVRELLAGSA